MNYEFDFYGDRRDPQLILCKPNRSKIAVLSRALDRRLNLNFNSVSELQFTVPYMVNGVETDNYDNINYLKKIYIDTLQMYFNIGSVDITGDGIYEKKNITCYSLESSFVYRGFFLPKGVYQLYNPVTPQTTILGMVLKTLPNWQMGYIDAELFNVWRSFEDTEEDLYSFLNSTLSETFGCVFSFSSVKKEINSI